MYPVRLSPKPSERPNGLKEMNLLALQTEDFESPVRENCESIDFQWLRIHSKRTRRREVPFLYGTAPQKGLMKRDFRPEELGDYSKAC